MSNKLYRIELGYPFGDYYVVASDSTKAYSKLMKLLDSKDWGVSKHREVRSIHLIAEDKEYPECETRLVQ